MSFNGFLLGFLVSILPLIVLLRIFKGKFLFTEQPMTKGALMGFLLWLMAVIIVMVDSYFDVIGFMREESGFALAGLIFTSHAGFITAGIVLAFMLEKVAPKKKE